MPNYLQYCSLWLLTVLLCTCVPRPDEGANVDRTQQRPNVLFIAVDDLRPELGVYGRGHIYSPHIDRLAARGMVFTNAYCNVPVCGASRASLMTGIRPTRDHFVNYSTRISEDAPGVATLHGHFRAAGYRTLGMGKVLHHASDREEDYSEPVWMPGIGDGAGRDYHSAAAIALVEEDNGGRGPAFERGVLGDSTYMDGKLANYAIAKLAEVSGTEEPFFMAVGFKKPHLPFNVPETYWARYDSTAIDLPPTYFRAEGTPAELFHNSGELRNYVGVPNDRILPEDYARTLIQGYYASVSYVDAQIGRLLRALEQTGEADRTIVVLWGDHGWNLGDHTMWCKHTVFNSSIRVPLIISAPGMAAGSTSAMVEFIDLFPTLAELAGLELPAQLDGQSLVPLLEDPDANWDDAVYTRWITGDNITTERYAYTEWRDSNGTTYARALFDHLTDSLETNNLAEQPEYADRVRELSERLMAETKRTAALK
ncbi:Ulvan-active sulfatase [Neolewinella maritima]|uniref:Ulvan-active sulfatase n=1 Tax=Neolewinella maritima TaxID=1383882 RepID=A0ABM9B3Q8_9BACT|nr:sulfatase [Neolewinella maritima]CAH1001857.1 Ulvan-active sulfatase [Neolewinella maritima]